ncbi:MAG TPA: glycosyltransferase family 39 protein, partial [Chloroflexota bacterium]|nr:glycosyltransferase family 39 protein [Chloroflexota bacterium]
LVWPVARKPPSRGSVAAASVVVLCIAAFFSFYRLTDFPPGLHVDTAVGGFDVQQVLHGHQAIFFPINMGHGAAYVYFEAAVIGLAGTHRISYGFAGIAMGLLGIAASMRLLKVMFGARVGLLSGAFLASSLWVLFINRIGVWQSTMLLGTAAPLYFIWRTMRWGRWRDVWLGGLALGLSQYGYYAIRFLPVLVLLLFVAELRVARTRARQLGALIGISLIAFLPEGIYFALHPAIVLQRPDQVAIFSPNAGETLIRILDGLRRTAGMFFVIGDYRPWQAVPNRPVFDPALAAVFCLGLLLALLRWRDARYRWILLWLVAMLLPTALTSDAPSYFRALGAAPATYVFPVLGLLWVWNRLGSPARSGLVAAAVIIAVEGAIAYDQYFLVWGPSTQAAIAFDAQDTAIARFAEQHPGERVYFSDIRTLGGQPVRALVPATEQAPWYPEDSAAIPLPASGGGDVLYAGSPRSSIGKLAPAWLPGVQELSHTTAADPGGMWAFRWPAASRQYFLAGQIPFRQTFGRELRIVSYSLTHSSGSVQLSVLWQQLRPAGPYDLYTHVFNAAGHQVAQGDKLYFPVETLGLKERPGEGVPTNDLLLTRYAYLLPAGHYTVEIGAVHRSVDHLSTLLTPAGQPAHLALNM